MSIPSLIKDLKKQGQDFEFYPTTSEMINCINEHFKNFDWDKRKPSSILDIGAGNGKVLDSLDFGTNLETFAIEKNDILINELNSNTLVVGRDIFQTSLIEKEFDLIFSNPPYSEYEKWADRIIREANAKYIALIIPQRWKNSKIISEALKARKGIINQEVLGSFDFLESEDREARAKVDILFIELSYKEDIFQDFLKNAFGLDLDSISESYATMAERQEERDRLENATKEVASSDIIDTLCKLYERDLNELVESVSKLKSIHPKIFKSLNIDKDKLTKSIANQLRELKALYWSELFNKLDTLTSRIIPAYRSYVSSFIASENGIEFNKGNIYAILIWAIKNTNHFIHQGFLALFDDFANNEALEYKSNKKFINNTWRYNDEYKFKAKKLDYGVVLTRSDKGLNESLKVLAKNLGFKTSIYCSRANMEFKEFLENRGSYFFAERFHQLKHNGTIMFDSGDIFFEWKGYKNGNIHLKFNKEFIAKFNIQVGKLRNWLTNKEEAKEAFPEVKESLIDEAFSLKTQIGFNEIKLLSA